MDPKLKAVYERMYAREMAARAIIFRQYPSFVASWTPDPLGKAIPASVVHRWWREQSVFAFRHEGHYYFPTFQFANGAPKSFIRRLLILVQPKDGWHSMFWFVGANAWLEDGSPVDFLDSDPAAVIEAACHANDEISD